MTTKIVVNCETGVSETIALTAEEIADLEKMAEESEALRLAREAELEAKAETLASARTKLEALGLTEDEAKALLG